MRKNCTRLTDPYVIKILNPSHLLISSESPAIGKLLNFLPISDCLTIGEIGSAAWIRVLIYGRNSLQAGDNDGFDRNPLQF